MNKPITILRNDYMSNLCAITNNSGLPAFVMIDVLERMITQLNTLAQAELQRDITLYNDALAKEKNAEDKSNESE